MRFKQHSHAPCFLTGANEFFRHTILSEEYFLQTTPGAFSGRNVLFFGTDREKITECAIKPNILQANGSYVILDRNGDKLKSFGHLLEHNGYEIRILNFCSNIHTHTYNPFLHIKHTRNLQTLVDTILGTCIRPFYTQKSSLNTSCHGGYQSCVETAAAHLLRACVYYLVNECNQADQNMYTLKTLLESAEEKIPAEQESEGTILAYLFDSMNDCSSNRSALREYKQFCSCCPDTRKDARMLLLAVFEELEEQCFEPSGHEENLSISDLQDKKIAIFLLTEETKQNVTKLYCSLFIAQLFDTLLESDSQNCSQPKEPVKLFLDDDHFISRIPDLAHKLFALKQQKSNVTVFLSLDSIQTLQDIYREESRFVLKQMDFQLYFPCMDDETRKHAISLIKPHCDTLLGRFVKNLRNGIIYHSRIGDTQSADILLFYQQELLDKVTAYPYRQHPRYSKTADYDPNLSYKKRSEKPDYAHTPFHPEGGRGA